MAEKQRNVLIANGHELIGQLSWPTGGGKKWKPYSIAEARQILQLQLLSVADIANATPKQFAPRGEITAQVVLHPAFLAKSYFPATILRTSGLVIVGSKPVKVIPRRAKKETNRPTETASIFVSGTAENFEEMNERLLSIGTPAKHQEQFERIEFINAYSAIEKLRISTDSPWPDHVHITLHATEADTDIQVAFRELVETLGGQILDRGFRFVPGLTFVAVRIPPENIQELARFTRIRLVRSLPELQEELILDQNITKGYNNISVPTENPLSTIRTAIFDGGISNVFPGHANEISIAGQLASSPSDLAHGI